MVNNYRQHPIRKYRIKEGKKVRAITTLAIAVVCAVALITLLLTAVAKIFGGGSDEQQLANNENQTVEASKAKEYNLPPTSEKNDLLEIVRTKNGSDKKICYITYQ